MTDKTSEIKALEDRIAALRAEIREDQMRAAKAFVPSYIYTVAPSTPYGDRYLDPSYIVYKIEGTVTNADSAPAGYSPFQGSGSYLFNRAAGHFVQGLSGSMHAPTPGFGNRQDVDWTEVYAELSEFLAEHPEGGDVTDIIIRMKERVA